MTAPAPLTVDQVYRRCLPDCLAFETTADLPEANDFIGQQRAEEAVAFGIAIERPGYNMFVMGRDGSGRSTLIGRFLRNAARGRPAPNDWVYVHNFDEPHRPTALALAPGQGQSLRREMAEMIEDLRTAIPAAFEDEAYRARVGEIAQLRKDDVRQDGGLWTLTITPEAGTVKTDEARTIPLHPHLVALGFPEFVRQAPTGHLFLRPAKNGDVLGPLQGVKNRLAEFARAIVPDRNVAPNHGWRHRFKTVGLEAGIDHRTLDAIQGHSPRTAGESYGEVTLKAMAAAMEKVTWYSVDCVTGAS